jgi:hypothetical protein
LFRPVTPDASALIDELSQAAMLTLPPPADGTIYLIGDLTIKQKSGRRTPLVHKTRMNYFEPYVYGLELVLLIAQWGRFRVPLSCDVVEFQTPIGLRIDCSRLPALPRSRFIIENVREND